MKDTIISSFDNTLAKHFKRLAGTNQGINGLCIKFFSLVSCMLLALREIEISSSEPSSIERYRYESFVEAMSDFGIEEGKNIRQIIDMLIEKKYIALGDNGVLIPMKPTMIMAKLIDKIFPKMPGIHFIAFTVQTIQEALTNRNSIDEAISRYDQTLYNHGKALSNNSSVSDAKKTQTIDKQHFYNNNESCAKKSWEKTVHHDQGVLTALKKIFQSDKKNTTFLNKTVVLPKNTKPKHEIKIREVHFKQAIVKNEIMLKDKGMPQQPVNTGNENISSSANNMPDESLPLVKEAVSDEKPIPLPKCSLEPLQKPQPNEIEPLVLSLTPVSICDKAEENDKSIADRITTFEEELALICPCCKVFMLKKMATTTGKFYYVCSSEMCNFISWGRPHHIVCKRCGNPFLIEVGDSTEETLLKCPRATCKHRQSSTPKKVKVVRKRLVRRRN